MNHHNVNFTRYLVLACMASSLCLMSSVVRADSDRGARNKSRPSAVRHQMYYKNRYYPIGHRLNTLPRGYLSFTLRGGRYYYQSGVYYRHRGTGYVVVPAPIGAYINVLPYGYRTFYFGGIPYFYASGAYYIWNDRYRSYEVVDQPGSIADMQEQPLAEAKDIFVYPNHGQSTEQTSRDRYECYLWAVKQTGFDPSAGEPGDANAYQRALGACLEGRGYTVK